VNPTCSSTPCAAELLGDVGCTRLSGIAAYNHELTKKGGTIATNAHIFGPFEAGFSTQQKMIIENWGCKDATVAYDTVGGTDIAIAELRVSYLCKIKLPRTLGDTYYGVVGPCGGHTRDYHFHRSFSCLYCEKGGHSVAVGNIAQWKLYGKWEDYESKKLPLLDACGAHFGPTPCTGLPLQEKNLCNGALVYHYHVQEKAPFTVGCHGPTADNKLVSVAKCRALYPKCAEAAENITISATKKVSYARFCPCYDADGMNTGPIKELPALGTKNISYVSTTGSTGVTSTACGSKTGASKSGDVVTMVTLIGLDFDKVNANATVKAALVTNIKDAFLANMTGYTKDDLTVVLTKGSVKATVAITPKNGSNTAALKTLMTSQKAATESAVLTKVKAMPAVSSLLENGKSLSDLQVQVAPMKVKPGGSKQSTSGSKTSTSGSTGPNPSASSAPESMVCVAGFLSMSWAFLIW